MKKILLSLALLSGCATTAPTVESPVAHSAPPTQPRPIPPMLAPGSQLLVGFDPSIDRTKSQPLLCMLLVPERSLLCTEIPTQPKNPAGVLSTKR